MAKRRDEPTHPAPETSPLADDEHVAPPPESPPPPIDELAPKGIVIQHAADDRVGFALAALDKIDADIRALGNPRAAIDAAAAKYTRLMAEKPGKIKALETECGEALSKLRAHEYAASASLVMKTTLEAKRAKAFEEVRKAEAAVAHEREVAGRIAAATAA